MRLHAYYSTPAWFQVRDAVRARARGRCEFCQVRPMQHCHHRTYVRFGQERLADLMAVCQACHQAIHGLLKRGTVLTCAEGSLLAMDDSGLGMSSGWRQYLRTCPVARVARHRASRARSA